MRYSSSAQGWFGQTKQQLFSLFLASPCPLCQRSTAAVVCPSCCRQVRQCQAPTSCDRTLPGLTVVSWGRYEGSLRQVIGSLKYTGHTEVAQFLGTELAQTWRDGPSGSVFAHRVKLESSARPVAIVPIPLHPTKLQQRGFNQADLLARSFCRLNRLPLHSHGLQRVLATQAQHSLSRAARQQNLAQAFAVEPNQISALRQATVWLLDDILTTGATAQAAAQALRQQGIAVAGICTVARAIAWDTNSKPTGSSGISPRR
ncbi:ComF family protein [Nodosilinea sp. LEGE 06152]|uniref:ComF family protein n=1 Tax=Nodosilinea sp. LEGE 06152 TaxID=2777966 RepID=UPI00187E2E3F|nr:phosphoribosyltransferase family protein [Nodosilinea sp. LEGE 06152]MBE9159147.1 ComF family protein [Nodosilinea sp. LEGE 06152]